MIEHIKIIIPFLDIRSMGCSRKNPKGDGGEQLIYFSDSPPSSSCSLRIFSLSFYPQKSRAFTPASSAKFCDTPWKFQGQKPRPMKIPLNFFLNTPGNSTSFLIDPWNFHMLYLTPIWVFFWNSPMLRSGQVPHTIGTVHFTCFMES